MAIELWLSWLLDSHTVQQHERASPEQSMLSENQHSDTEIISELHLIHKKIND